MILEVPSWLSRAVLGPKLGSFLILSSDLNYFSLKNGVLYIQTDLFNLVIHF